MSKSRVEDDYGCTLSEDTRTIARAELREDDTTKEQALDQFRCWIQKHPAIKRCRTDALFLLRFLRTKKFSLPMAEEMLERYLTIRQLYPNWFQNLDIQDPDIEAIIDAGYLIPLVERDRHGRRVILSCAGKHPTILSLYLLQNFRDIPRYLFKGASIRTNTRPPRWLELTAWWWRA